MVPIFVLGLEQVPCPPALGLQRVWPRVEPTDRSATRKPLKERDAVAVVKTQVALGTGLSGQFSLPMEQHAEDRGMAREEHGTLRQESPLGQGVVDVAGDMTGGNHLAEGCQTHFHQGLHEPHGCLQRAKNNFKTV